jgi:hypothetical protein
VTNIVGGVVPAVTSIVGGLPVVSPIASVIAPVGPVVSNILGGAGGLLGGGGVPTLISTSPRPAATTPGVLASGTLNECVYNYTFYTSGIIQINNSFLSPKAGALSGYLPDDRTFVGAFTDGLHIGQSLVPYPVNYVTALIGVTLLNPTILPANLQITDIITW